MASCHPLDTLVSDKKRVQKIPRLPKKLPVNPELRSKAQKLKRYLSTMEVVAICKNGVIYGADETREIRSDRDQRIGNSTSSWTGSWSKHNVIKSEISSPHVML